MKKYKTIYKCPVCNLEKIFIGVKGEEPVKHPVCCAPMEAVSYIQIEYKENQPLNQNFDYPIIFKRVANDLDKNRIHNEQENKISDDNYIFNLKLTHPTKKIIRTISKYYPATTHGINQFILDAIVMYNNFLTTLQSPGMEEIVHKYEREKQSALRWYRKIKGAQKFKNYISEFKKGLKQIIKDSE